MRTFDTVLIDADQIVYSVGFAAKGEPLNFCLQTVKNKLDKIQRECNAENRKVFIKGKGNFRTAIAVTDVYKGTRPKDKPVFYDEMYEYLREHQDASAVDWMEADDIVSVLLWRDYIENLEPDQCKLILSSADKDLKNTPGWHHNPQSGALEFYTEEQSTRHFWYQMLLGDRTDNIRGLPYVPLTVCTKFGLSPLAFSRGIGKESAKKLLSSTITAEEAEVLVYYLYMEWGDSLGWTDAAIREYITEQGQLLWMTRELNEFYHPIKFIINEERYERARQRFTEERYDSGFESEARREEVSAVS